MGVSDSKFQVVYRGEVLEHFKPGGWVFFQRPKECGGGYWIEYERPVSLSEGMIYLTSLIKVEARSNDFDENFSLF